MKFAQPLRQGVFKKRYKRFFTDIEYEGEILTAHCPNTGSMMGLKDRDQLCRFSVVDDPKRKLKYTLQMVKTKTSWVGVNTALPNKLVSELFEKSPLPHWQKFDSLQPEVKINDKSRIDLVLWDSKKHDDSVKWNQKNLQVPLHLIEVKNVTLAENGVAYFPDAVTSRGLKHLEELIDLQNKGFTCEMLYVVQRTDCEVFKPAQHIDKAYAEKLSEACQSGVKITALPCDLTQNSVSLVNKEMKVDLS